MKHLDFSKKDSNLLYVNKPELKCSIGIAAKNCNTVNYEQNLHKIRKFERYLVHFETGTHPDKIFFLNQKHEDRIIEINSPCDATELFHAEADGMITNLKNYCLVIRTADCVPVMIYDPVEECAAAVHSGWRSTEKNIAGKSVSRLKEKYNSKPENLKIFLLPAIGVDSYEVSEEVAMKFPGNHKSENGKFYVDLKGEIRDQLVKEGCDEENIFNSFQDTFTHNQTFFSHRKDDDGRNLNYIIIK